MKLYVTVPELFGFKNSPRARALAFVALCLFWGSNVRTQTISLTGSSIFWVANGQALQAPDGFVVTGNSTNILPRSLTLNDGDVLLGTPSAVYKVHDVPATASAVFYSAFLTDKPNDAGLTVVNGASGTSDFTLRLDNLTALGDSSLPVAWVVSQTSGSGFGNLTFTWGADLEPEWLSHKRLYVYSGSAWSSLPAANTTVGIRSLTYSGYTGTLSAVRFGIATGLYASATPVDPACTGGTGSITVAANGGFGARTYKLDNGSWQSASSFTGLAAGTYTVYVKDDLGDEVSVMVTVTDPEPATASVTGETSICSGESTTLTASGGTSYNWSGGLGSGASITVSPNATTTYSVTVTNVSGCIATAAVTVSFYAVQSPVVSYEEISGVTDNDGTVCAGAAVGVTISGGTRYVWSDGGEAGTRSFTPACTTPYDLTVTDPNGCTSTSSLTITVNREPLVREVSPVAGVAGTVIHIYGVDLENAVDVNFNGQPGLNLTRFGNTHITATLPFSGALQQVTLLSPCGDVSVQISTPAIASFTPGAGGVGTIVTLTGSSLDKIVSASVGGVEAVILSRSATSAKIMVMPGAVTGTVAASSASGTISASSTFTVNPTPYPYFQQGSKLANNSVNATQGSSVTVSADGNTAVIGGPGDNSGVGAAWVYTRSGTAWSLQSKLVGTGNTGASKQGTSVAVSADGNTVVVGAPGDNSGAGAVWVFTRSGTVWTQQGGKLMGTGAVGPAQQGFQTAVSGDGNTLAIGGYADDSYAGAVWTFVRYGNVWAQFGEKFVGAGASGKARQGSSVSLNEDGTRLIEGGYQDNNRQGAVWVYSRSDCGWIQLGSKLVGTGGTGQAWQGYSVSLSADGNTAVAGGPNNNALAGATWIYTYVAGAWTQQARLLGTQAAGAARQGTSVTLSADGNTVMTGALADDGNKGAVWVFKKTGAQWAQQGAKIKGTNAVGAAKQGSAVSVSATGHTALIGGPTDNSNKGAFWVYVPQTIIPAIQQAAFEERHETQISGFRLDQNNPNPAAGKTVIPFCLPEACEVEWKITDASGRVIQSLKRVYPAGENTESFELSGCDGMYWYSIRTQQGVLTRKMLIVGH